MHIALIQQHLAETRELSLAVGLKNMERAAQDGAQLVAFAELAFDPFFPRSPRGGSAHPLAEPVPGPTTDALAAKARELGIVVVANLYERCGEDHFDSSPVIDADGSLLGVTRMLHICDYPGFHERDYYERGDRGMPVYQTQVGRVGVAICYDRHYPEVMRRLGLDAAELVVIPQAGTLGEWPDGLYEAEIRVAAFQNGYFAALCNRVGSEGQLEFGGESFVSDPQGQVIARSPAGEDHILHAELDLGAIADSTAKKLFLCDRRTDWDPR